MPTVLRIELTITPKPININHHQQKSLMDTREQVKHLHFKLLFGRTNKDHIKSMFVSSHKYRWEWSSKKHKMAKER